MPSSTFSFERAPSGAPAKIFLVALVFVVLILGAVEHYLRSLNGNPSVLLSDSRYAAHLANGLGNPDSRTTLLLGASRIRSGFSSRTFDTRTDHAPLYYLATSGESPLALIVYLAMKTDFSGKLIVSLRARSLSGNALDEQKYIVDYFENKWNLNLKLNHMLGDRLASWLVFRQQHYSIANVIKSAVKERELPPVPYWRRHSVNGETFYDFSLVRDRSLLKPPIRRISEDQLNHSYWEANLSRLRRAIARLRERGAQVALVRFPTSGYRWASDQKHWLRARYWDRIAATVDAVTVHFKDVEAMGRFNLPDSSHIDSRDKDAFTEALLDSLHSHGMTWNK